MMKNTQTLSLNSRMKKRIAIIGAGAMGLSAAYYAIKKGYRVSIFEADRIPGGMAAHFDLDGMSIERFYHFICKSDKHTFQLLDDLCIREKLIWKETKMGYFISGKHYSWGNPLALLFFPLMNIFEKIRYGFFVFFLTKKKDFNDIEHLTMKDWMISKLGKRVYSLMWERLSKLKFYEYTDKISASWIATRIKRIGNSRKSIMKEELGYIDGGSETLVNALVKFIEKHDGEIFLSTQVKEVLSIDDTHMKVITDKNEHTFEKVISTIPTPLISKMFPQLTDDEKQNYDSIENIGVVCVVHKIKKQITENFWLNIIDEDFEIPGIIEFSNLRKVDAGVVYVPYYMPITNSKFTKPDDFFINESRKYICKINKKIKKEDFLFSYVGRLKYSQPICEPNFYEKIPSVQTSINGLQIADTCFYYPEDRGISESIGFAKKMVNNL